MSKQGFRFSFAHLCLILGLLLFGTQAHAYIFLEPDLGYEYGNKNIHGVAYGGLAAYRFYFACTGVQYEKGLGGKSRISAR